MQQTMDDNAAVYRTEETLKQARPTSPASRSVNQQVSVSDRGKRYNTELLEAVKLGFLLNLAEVSWSRAPRRVPNHAGVTSARTSPPVTMSTSCATPWLTRGGSVKGR